MLRVVIMAALIVSCGKSQDTPATPTTAPAPAMTTPTPIAPSATTTPVADTMAALSDPMVTFLTADRIQHWIAIETEATANPFDRERKKTGMVGRRGTVGELRAFAQAHGFTDGNEFEVVNARITAGQNALANKFAGKVKVSDADRDLVKAHLADIEAAQTAYQARQKLD